MNKLRYKIFQSLAQTQPPTALPTTEVAQTQTVSGSPISFIATDYYPSIIIAFTPKNATIINNLSNLLNTSLFYTSNGQTQLAWMRSVNFNFSTDDVPSIDLKNIMGFCKQLYNNVYTDHGSPDKVQLKPEEIAKRIAPLKNSSFISNMSATNPTGQLSTKIGGNLKTMITDFLLQIV